MSIPISQFTPPPSPPSLALSFPLYPSPSSHSHSFSGSYFHFSLSVSSTSMQAGFSTKPKTRLQAACKTLDSKLTQRLFPPSCPLKNSR